LNAAYNKARIIVTILDNSTTMTGHQPHPGTGLTATGEQMAQISEPARRPSLKERLK